MNIIIAPAFCITGGRHHALRDLAANQLSALLGVIRNLGELFEVLHLVIGCLDDDAACGVVAGSPGPARDLVKLACVEQPGA